MHFGKKNPRSNYTMQAYDSNNLIQIEKTETERDLGIQISSNLKYAEQVNKAASKANSVLGMLKRTFATRDTQIWKKLYTTYVRPQLEFAVSAWNPYLKKDIETLEKVQRRATKIGTTIKKSKLRKTTRNSKTNYTTKAKNSRRPNTKI